MPIIRCKRCGKLTNTGFTKFKWRDYNKGTCDGCFLRLDEENKYEYGCRWKECKEDYVLEHAEDKIIKFNWDDFLIVMEEIKQDPIFLAIIKKIDNIIGIERGGLIPAVCLSHHFEKNLITFKPFEIENIPNSLYIDDIVHSGETVKNIIDNKECFVLSLYINEGFDKPEEIIHYRKAKPNEWVVFPWENETENKLKKHRERQKKCQNNKTFLL